MTASGDMPTCVHPRVYQIQLPPKRQFGGSKT